MASDFFHYVSFPISFLNLNQRAGMLSLWLAVVGPGDNKAALLLQATAPYSLQPPMQSKRKGSCFSLQGFLFFLWGILQDRRNLSGWVALPVWWGTLLMFFHSVFFPQSNDFFLLYTWYFICRYGILRLEHIKFPVFFSRMSVHTDGVFTTWAGLQYVWVGSIDIYSQHHGGSHPVLWDHSWLFLLSSSLHFLYIGDFRWPF